MQQKSTRPHESSPAEVADRLHSAAIHLLRRLRRADQSSGLSAPKLSALSVIVYAGPISIGDLAAAEQVQAPTMTRVVKDLEDQGLVERLASSDDRRVSRVKATASGVRLLKQGRDHRVKLLAEFTQTLSGKELRQLGAAVQTIERFTKNNSA
jgi:DNA-binding MarR family transcriptional regulator